MKTRTIGTIIFGLASIVVVGFTIYKISIGKETGLNEVITIGALLIGFFSTMTWGTKEEKDGILQDEELGQRITEKSSKISYFLLTLFIFAAVFIDNILNETLNILLLLLLGLSMITLPFIEYLYSRKYQ
ncbi:hypothetical protein [Niallia sp. Man26]|uniref:hypothetical protein n=1 Tax=Niallia sp. Man26 TaxID=2912824 RepID=UPI001EDAE9EA|nr:hypothetical protein [Niallia sp. Man26]UPO89933.1 hypothetical protein L8T27_024440 [Niallia sp. Man26]